MTEDLIRYGNNWYTYVGNNPVSYIDPSGLEPVYVNGEPSDLGSGWSVHSSTAVVQQGGTLWNLAGRFGKPQDWVRIRFKGNPRQLRIGQTVNIQPLLDHLESGSYVPGLTAPASTPNVQVNSYGNTSIGSSGGSGETPSGYSGGLAQTAQTLTLQRPGGGTATVYTLGPNNPALAGLPKQENSALNPYNDPTNANWGCNAFADIAASQLAAGINLSSAQYLQLLEAARSTPSLYNNGMVLGSQDYVNNYRQLSDMVLSYLGRTDIGLTFGGTQPHKGMLLGYLGTMPYGKETHTALYGPDAQNVAVPQQYYNPGFTNIVVISWMPVFVYPR